MSWTDFVRLKKGKWCSKNREGVLKVFVPSSSSVQDAIMVRNECEQYCRVEKTCWGCSVDCGNPCQWSAILTCGTLNDWGGMIEGDVTYKQGITLVKLSTSLGPLSDIRDVI